MSITISGEGENVINNWHFFLVGRNGVKNSEYQLLPNSKVSL
jgi:hypothetical protein